MLNICPTTRMVAIVPAAEPRCFLSTEPMTALEFGEENSENPRPITIRAVTTNSVDVCRFSMASKARPIAVKPMPEEARRRGSCRSDILPASGENNVITRGWEIMTKTGKLRGKSLDILQVQAH